MFLYESILDINQSVQNHSEIIDQVEKKLLEVNKIRKDKKEKQNQNNVQFNIERIQNN